MRDAKRGKSVQVQSLKKSLKDFTSALEKAEQGKKFGPVDKVTFSNIEVFRKVVTRKRVELLRIIGKAKPESIKELARITERDYKSINTDLKILLSMKMIKITKVDHKAVPSLTTKELNLKIPLVSA